MAKLRSAFKLDERGLALMIVIWILVLMITLATEFSVSMRTEVLTTTNQREDTEAYYLAKAGINLAMAELLKNAKYHAYTEDRGFIVGKPDPVKNEQGQFTNAKGEIIEEGEEEEEEIVVREDIPLGPGTITYTIRDENSKININTADRPKLIKALRAAGLELGETRDIIADSILDWIDRDNNHRINGAEDNYYKTLDPPYAVKNDKFDSIDELIRVRGITEEILYGTPEGEESELGEGSLIGLDKIFTVQNISRINPNTASREVLSIEYSEAELNKLLENREAGEEFKAVTSTHFKIESTGNIDGSNTFHTIVAIIEKLGTDDKASLVIRYWNDNRIES